MSIKRYVYNIQAPPYRQGLNRHGKAPSGLICQLIVLALLILSGCGYTTGSLLPAHLKAINVENFANKIPLTDEVSDSYRYKTYRPLLEVDITRSIIDRFIFDGHLRVVPHKDADLVLEGDLVDFRREPTKYGYDDAIDQYRIAIFVDIRLIDTTTGKVMWSENNFAGSDYYFTTGPQQKSENAAVTGALDDLARRVVERTIEAW
jgi:hypothetical protein